MDKSTVIILGAGRPLSGDEPSALFHTSKNQRVLDWIISGFSRVVTPEFFFVGGYRYEDIIDRYPNINFSVNPHWQTSGSLASLLRAPLTDDRTTYVVYSDVVFQADLVRFLESAQEDVVVAVDRTWRQRYHPRAPKDIRSAEKVQLRGDAVVKIDTALDVDAADAEYAGVMKLSPAAIQLLFDLRKRLSNELTSAGIPRLIEIFLEHGLEVRAVEADGIWAELNTPRDLARFVLGTKAETLDRLRPMVRMSSIGAQKRFTVAEWSNAPNEVIRAIQECFADQRLVIRSSALSEDGWKSSNAGGFTSVLDVPCDDVQRLTSAIEEVIDSYGETNPGHQVLVQAMLSDVKMSGVVFTRTLSVGGPYYTINFDDSSSSTDSVTSGAGRELRTVVVYRNAVDSLLVGDAHQAEVPSESRREVAATAETIVSPHAIEERLLSQHPLLWQLLQAIREVEELVGHDSLDIEFAVTADNTIHILQVRPIAVDHGQNPVSDERLEAALREPIQRFLDFQRSSPFVVGRKPVFGVMPDWNPAEIIGTNPRRLSRSLYQYLIMDQIWAAQRAEYGYRDVRPHPLLVNFAGHPYVDVRASFNSFVPASLPDKLAERLVDHYLERLESNPHFHDKVEFDIALTCLTFDFHLQAQRLQDAGFAPSEIEALRKGLAEITRDGIERCETDFQQIEALQRRYEKVMQADLPPLDRAYILLEDCRRYGTLLFSHLARAGFVAVSLLRSLEVVGVTRSEQTAAFLNSLQTVARSFELDGAAVANGQLAWEAFVERYGHLRPGTYEITSPAYAADPDRYLRPMVRSDIPAHDDKEAAIWDQTTRAAISDALKKAGLPDDVDHFARFLRTAIEGREYSKFVFTRNLSAALESIAEFGSDYGLSREELSHISIDDLLEIRTGPPPTDLVHWLRERSVEGAAWYRVARAVELPPLLFDPVDFVCFERPRSQPNFVTHGQVIAPLVDLSGVDAQSVVLKGKIVMIPQADPGYDWLFGHDIAGLITMYGGANSHMAIRSAEFGLPAAIGVGEKLYAEIAAGEVVELDCAGNRIAVLR